jgi:drug/metabolite transporter (DMT)-like permease
MITVLLMYAFLALTFIVSKDLLATIDPYLMIVIRMLGCSIIFGVYAFFSRAVKPLSRAYTVAFIVLGFFNVYAANTLQLIGLEYIDSVNASLWYNCIPFVIALLDYCVYKTRISKTKLAALFLGWFGFIPLIIGNTACAGNYLYGALLFVLSACAMGVSALLMEKNKAINNYSLSFTNALSMVFGAFCAYVHYAFVQQASFVPWHVLNDNIVMLALLIGATALCAGLYIYFVKKHSALLVTFAGFSLPLFSVIFELLLGRPVIISINMIISAVLITTALFLFKK